MRRRRYGSASVEEHPKGSGAYRVRTRIGRKLKTIASGLSEREAHLVADQYTEERDAGALREGLTLGQFGATALNLRGRRGSRSIDKDRNRWETYISGDPIGDIPLVSLRRSDVVEWRDRCLARLKANTVRNALNLLRVALGDALDRELVTENVARDVRVPRGLDAKSEEDLSGVLEPAEQTELLRAVPSQWRDLVIVAMFSGLRWSELAHLRREDIKGGNILVRRSVGGGPTKSGKARTVPILPPVELALRRQLKGHRSPWVFPSADGKPRKYRPSAWPRWVKAAGITRRVRWHDLRHTCATALLAGWWSQTGQRWAPDEVCSMLGHANLSTTEIYMRKVDETLQNAAASMVFKTFPQGNENEANLPEAAAGQRIPKPKVGRSSRLGGASEITQESGAVANGAGNILGTTLERTRARLEALAETVGCDDPEVSLGLAVARATAKAIAGEDYTAELVRAADIAGEVSL